MQGEDLRVLPKAKLGSNHWVFATAALLTQQQEQQQQQQQQGSATGASWAAGASLSSSSHTPASPAQTK